MGLRMCGSHEDAEDLVQETFLARSAAGRTSVVSPRRRRGFSPSRPGPASGFTGAKGRTRSRSSHSTRFSRRTTKGILDVPSPDEGPLEGVLREEARAAVTEALHTMPAPFRIAFILKDLGEFSMAEAAEILGIKEATVKTRVHRARLHLAKQLKKRMPKKKDRAAGLRLAGLFRRSSRPRWTRSTTAGRSRCPTTTFATGARRCSRASTSASTACKDLRHGGVPEPLRRSDSQGIRRRRRIDTLVTDPDDFTCARARRLVVYPVPRSRRRESVSNRRPRSGRVSSFF